MRRTGDAAAGESPASNPLALDAILDLNAASRLRAALLARRGADLRVDASGVHHLGGQCAQVLAAAAASWAADGAALTVSSASAPFAQGARLLGLAALLNPQGSPA